MSLRPRLLLVFFLMSWPVLGRTDETSSFADILELPLESLMDIEVTSVSKKEQKLSESAAAVYVLTAEDVRRSGHTSIAEALRMVPGMEVARVDANKWAISSRGFNSPFAEKLLVLIDGRSVYDPLNSGVFWDVQDTLLEDLDRIEVIRGPGATLWGANAVNGVINVITKPSRQTQGFLVMGGGGAGEKAVGGIRYGGKIKDGFFYRIFAKYRNQSRFATPAGADMRDALEIVHGGVRADWEVNSRDALTLQGDIYGGDSGGLLTVATLSPPFSEIIDDDIKSKGGNFLGRWSRRFSSSSDMALQLYYNRVNQPRTIERLVHDTTDLDFQHHFAWGGRQDLVWGSDYRFTRVHVDPGFTFSLNPSSEKIHFISGFLQDEITLVKDRLRLSVGSKMEWNQFTGFEIQPSGRLLWTPHSRHTFWGAVSRAVRTPSLYENGSRSNTVAFPNPDGSISLIGVLGGPSFQSEDLLAFEAGYRLIPSKKISFDLAAYLNFYDHLHSTEMGVPAFEADPAPPHVLIPLTYQNLSNGRVYGVELASRWDVFPRWTLSAAYTFLKMHVSFDASSNDTSGPQREGQDPEHQFHVRSFLDLPHHLEFDTLFYFVDRLKSGPVPRSLRLDARLGWRPIKNLDVSVVGQNLLKSRHAEFVDVFFTSAEVPRSVYGKLTWTF